MIRSIKEKDLETVLEIWLDVSIKAHCFIDAGFWKSQLDNMRNIYIPASETYVYEVGSKVVGFYSLHEDTLAAIFVSQEFQRQGIGKALLSHAKAQRKKLSLCVYVENSNSCQFYLSQGFRIVGEQADEHTGHQEYTMHNESI